jgi:hypothetical protein
MAVITGLWFVDILRLEDQGKWLLSSGSNLGELSGLGVRCKREVIIAAFLLVRSATLRMTPDSILKNVIPDVPSTGFRER